MLWYHVFLLFYSYSLTLKEDQGLSVTELSTEYNIKVKIGVSKVK